MSNEYTSLDLLMLNTVDKVLKKQGFNGITFKERMSKFENYTNYYECFCTYGDSGETYTVAVCPFSEKILTVHSI